MHVNYRKSGNGLPILGLALMLVASQVSAQENWPQWRGPDGNGVSAATGLPETWSDTENIVWKTPLPSWSGATPIIWGDRIFVMSPSKPEEGAGDQPGGGPKVLLLCIAKNDGSIVWERELDASNQLAYRGNYASPSPTTDGTHVWAATGSGTLVALDMNGEVVWKHNLQSENGPFGMQFGYAPSPVLCDGKILVQVLQGFKTDAPSYLAAYDANDGALKWHVERPTEAVHESRDSYATPAILRWEGKAQVIAVGGDCVTGSDVETGAELWRAGGLNPRHTEKNRIIVSPVAVDGMIHAASSKRPVIAVRAGGSGDITATHVAWTYNELHGPDVPTPACDGTYFYLLDDIGVITCFNAKTGAIVWGPEHTARGPVSASPVVADGKIYFTNEHGITTVLAAGPDYRVVATNTINGEGRTLSSFAISENRLYLRTATHLYCIGKQPQ